MGSRVKTFLSTLNFFRLVSIASRSEITPCNKRKKDSKDQESIQSSTTPVPGYQMGKLQNHNRQHKKSQEVSPFPSGDHKVAMNRRESLTNTIHNNRNDPQKKYRLGTVGKNILLEGLIRFHSAPTSPLVQMWIKTHRCLVCTKDP